MNERKELIARLRDYTYEGDPRHLMEAAADMLEADAQPQYGWLTACDEEMICAQLGVASLSDSFESAKQKLGELIAWHVAVATDPAVNGGLSLQPAVPQEPVAWKTDISSGKLRFTIGVQTFTIYYTVDDKEELKWMQEQLNIALSRLAAPQPQPQRPRLTDAEILALWAQTYVERGTSGIEFARAVEKKVRGEA